MQNELNRDATLQRKVASCGSGQKVAGIAPKKNGCGQSHFLRTSPSGCMDRKAVWPSRQNPCRQRRWGYGQRRNKAAVSGHRGGPNPPIADPQGRSYFFFVSAHPFCRLSPLVVVHHHSPKAGSSEPSHFRGTHLSSTSHSQVYKRFPTDNNHEQRFNFRRRRINYNLHPNHYRTWR